MEITQDKIDLITKIIKNDRKYPSNEDLFDDFLNETCQRSVAIISAIDNDSALEAYLKKVVTTSILNVLKDSGRLRRAKTGYMSTQEVPFEISTPAPTPEPVAIAPMPVYNLDYYSYRVNYAGIEIPKDPEENAIHHEILDFVAETINRIDSETPEERFKEIFLLRYDKGMTQREIAAELGISQSEVSKRLYGLIDRVKSIIDEQ